MHFLKDERMPFSYIGSFPLMGYWMYSEKLNFTNSSKMALWSSSGATHEQRRNVKRLHIFAMFAVGKVLHGSGCTIGAPRLFIEKTFFLNQYIFSNASLGTVRD